MAEDLNYMDAEAIQGDMFGGGAPNQSALNPGGIP